MTRDERPGKSGSDRPYNSDRPHKSGGPSRRDRPSSGKPRFDDREDRQARSDRDRPGFKGKQDRAQPRDAKSRDAKPRDAKPRDAKPWDKDRRDDRDKPFAGKSDRPSRPARPSRSTDGSRDKPTGFRDKPHGKSGYKATGKIGGKYGGKPGGKPERDPDETLEQASRRLSVAAEEKQALMESRMPGLAARRAALDILGMMRKGRALDEALVQTRTFHVLDGPDRGFARHMVSTSWRRRGSIDAVIGSYLDRPLPRNNVEVMDILRLAAVQLILLDTPAHAAVATATELAHQKQETRGYAKLVNAISRRLSEKGKAQLAALPPRTDTPGWLWRALERTMPATAVAAIAKAHQQEAPLDLSLKPDTDAASLNALEKARSLLPGHIRLPAGQDVAALPGFEAGSWWVQDIAASLPVRLMGDVAGKSVIDLCAAPGGKTLQLAAAGANVTAIDISGFRLQRLEENLERTGLTAKAIKADILGWTPAALVDAVLLDAPCTATGTIRRNPDVAWLKTEKDLKALTSLQANMLDRALTFLKPGGSLIYCVCSILRAEGEDQAKAALARHADLEIVPADPGFFPGLEKAIAKDGAIRTLPSMLGAEGGMDGFYAVHLRKTA